MIIASVAGQNVGFCHIGYPVETFSSAQEFLNGPPARVPGGIVFALSLPDLDGFALPERLAGRAALSAIFAGADQLWPGH